MSYLRDCAACALQAAAEGLGLAQHGGEKRSGRPDSSCQDPQGGDGEGGARRGEGGARLFTVVPGGTIRASMYKMKHEMS